MIKNAQSLLRFPFRLLPIVIFGILLTATLNIVIVTINYSDLDEQAELNATKHEERLWGEIEETIAEYYNSNRLISGQLALKIENGIIREYTDMNDLRYELENNIMSDRFHSVVSEIIKQDDLNSSVKPYLTLVGTRENLIIGSTNTESNLMQYIDTESLFEWESITDLTPNKEMTLNAIELVFNKDKGVIFTQTTDIYNDNFSGSSINFETLKSVYLSEGLKGLYDFSILTPGYITENGDIFGTDDRFYLSKNDNHKLIVAQVISLESILKDHGDEIALVIENNNMEQKAIEIFMFQQLTTTIAITVMLFIISLILIGVHNAEMDRRRRLDS